MIATLAGKLLLRHTDRVVVEAGGVGYEVFLSSDGLSRTGEIYSDVFLYIHTHVREDAFILYGFVEEEEKKMFLLLKTVSGVGPKLALSIISGMRVPELCRAIGSNDVKGLTALQGVGKRTAERLCVELKEKVGHLAAASLEEAGAKIESFQAAGSIQADVVSALVNLGYPDPQVRQALVTVKKRVGEEDFMGMEFEEMLKQGLRSLA
ncbi:MAG: Holliday junction branch migration protein RuvA [Desulfopila sp.]